LIRLHHTEAEEVAKCLKDVYRDLLADGPDERKQGGGDTSDRHGAPAPKSKGARTDRIYIGVVPRANSLVVAATDALFAEVKQLVEALDRPHDATDRSRIQVPNHDEVLRALEKLLDRSKRPVGEFRSRRWSVPDGGHTSTDAYDVTSPGKSIRAELHAANAPARLVEAAVCA